MFIGRAAELAELRAEFAAARPSLIIVYGRRRVGKSTLLQEATRGLPAIYYQATRGLASDNLAMFKDAAVQAIGDEGPLREMPNWFTMLNHLAALAERMPGLVVTLDEFPFLAETDNAIPSVIQKFVDSGAPARGKLKLVLCGSMISHMSELLAERNPLYGRQTGVYDVGPLPLHDAAQFFPGWPAEDIVTAYGILGGVPYYLETFDSAASLRENVIESLLARRGKLTDEPNYLLASETVNAPRYLSIMQAIADGCTKSGEIRNRITGGTGERDVSWYLDRLIRLRLVRAERSMDATPRERDRRYVLDDPLMRFWFRFVRPSLSAIRQGYGGQVWQTRVAPALPDFMGNAFEEICRQHVRQHAGELLRSPVAGGVGEDVGKIWAGDYDIDIAAELLDGSVVYGECKWRSQLMGQDVLDRLIECVGRTRFGADARHKHFLLFSKNGFTRSLTAAAKADPRIHLLMPDALVRPPDTAMVR